MEIRTRFAPSPTGNLHIGGARTALFCYLFAKHYNGSFIIRTDDSDISRNENDMIIKHIKILRWLGINEDESVLKGGKFKPYQQSKKFASYKKYTDYLLDKKRAYYCFCSKEELAREKEALKINNPKKVYKYSQKCLLLDNEKIKQNLNKNKSYSIRIKNIKNMTLKFDDLIRGEISFNSNDLDDFIIVRSNKTYTYNFINVIDDYEMKITHIFRGEEHISNTPKQILLIKLLDLDISFKYAHFNIIMNTQKKKMSKRNSDKFVFLSTYKKMGYHPEAILNFLALLG